MFRGGFPRLKHAFCAVRHAWSSSQLHSARPLPTLPGAHDNFAYRRSRTIHGRRATLFTVSRSYSFYLACRMVSAMVEATSSASADGLLWASTASAPEPLRPAQGEAVDELPGASRACLRSGDGQSARHITEALHSALMTRQPQNGASVPPTPLLDWIAEASASGDMPTVTVLPPSSSGAPRQPIVSWRSPFAKAPSPFAQAAATPFDQLVANSVNPSVDAATVMAPTSAGSAARTAARTPPISPRGAPSVPLPRPEGAAAPLNLACSSNGGSEEGPSSGAGRGKKAALRSASAGGQGPHDSVSSWRPQSGALDTPPASGALPLVVDTSSPDSSPRAKHGATAGAGGVAQFSERWVQTVRSAPQSLQRRRPLAGGSAAFDMPAAAPPLNLRSISAPGSLYGSCNLPLAELSDRLDSSPPSLSSTAGAGSVRASTADAVLMTSNLQACRSASPLHGGRSSLLRCTVSADQTAARETVMAEQRAASTAGQAQPSTASPAAAAPALPCRSASSGAVGTLMPLAEPAAPAACPPNPFMRATSAPSPADCGWDDGPTLAQDTTAMASSGSGSGAALSNGELPFLQQNGGAAEPAPFAGGAAAPAPFSSGGATVPAPFATSGAGGDDWAWAPSVAGVDEEPCALEQLPASPFTLSSPQSSGIFNTDREGVLPYKLMMKALHTGGCSASASSSALYPQAGLLLCTAKRAVGQSSTRRFAIA